MGIYLNPGKSMFEEALEADIYIDKTKMIQYLNSVVKTRMKYVSVSRPRRFGKSMAADMICAYYDRNADSKDLFLQTELSRCEPVVCENRTINWDSYLGAFDVIRLVMTDFMDDNTSVRDMLKYLNDEVTEELMETFPEVKFGNRINLRIVLNKIFATTKRQFIIVIDEWDAVFRKCKNDEEGQELYLDFLRDCLKDKPYVALAYITGILPIKKYGEHSALNMFDEYSMMHPMQMAEFTGFTTSEVLELCKEYNMKYEEISSWYDGYVISGIIPKDKREEYREGTYTDHKVAIYSPLSVVKAMTTGVIKNYWNKTETYEALAEYIKRNYAGLKEAVALLMNGGRLVIDTSTYKNDMTTFTGRDDVLSLLVHLGYLGFDDEKSEVFIPNNEILDEFKTSTKVIFC
ncbi:MAG: AAA family ATPase [Lachnospiraceae bacterium]|nr:AAA family ATPase [Lachnospiraceae bacterium]